LAVCLHISGDSSNESSGTDGSLRAELPSVVGFFYLHLSVSISCNLLSFQNLAVQRSFPLLDACAASEEVHNKVMYSPHDATGRGSERTGRGRRVQE
jgi:hypothetical protein